MHFARLLYHRVVMPRKLLIGYNVQGAWTEEPEKALQHPLRLVMLATRYYAYHAQSSVAENPGFRMVS